MYRIAFLCFLLFFTSSAYALFAQGGLPELTKKDVPEGQITRKEYFNGNSLWGYIDGGADIYLEYGFKRMLVQEVRAHNHHLKIDIYEMKGAEAAYGIFSISHNGCSSSDSVSRYSCITAHQVQIAINALYISIVNESGSSEEQNLGLNLAKKILAKVEEKAFSPPKLFRSEIYIPHIKKLRFINGILGIQNGFPQWEDAFEGIKNFALYLLPIDTKENRIVTAQIKFSEESDKIRFSKKLDIASSGSKLISEKTADGIFRAVREVSPMEIIYLESDAKRDDLQQFIKAMESVN